MNRPTPLSGASLPVPNLMSWSPLRRGFPVVLLALALALACFLLSTAAQAQLPSPTPDGGYPNGNTAEGDAALFSNTSGGANTATGFRALYSNTEGGGNTVSGYQALYLNTTGSLNTATGYLALYYNTTGGANTAEGSQALWSNTTGAANTAQGVLALGFNTTGILNTANGNNALLNNTTGSENTAMGAGALSVNSVGNYNTASGEDALGSNSRGGGNTAAGARALYSNTLGRDNTAQGREALLSNTTGSFNIAIGDSAGKNLTTGNHNIDIDAYGIADEGDTIRIGTTGVQKATHIAGIYGTVVVGGVGVIANSHGQLGTILSSARYKEAIKRMDKASEAILQLEPVTFRYKHELDPDGIPQFGLIAEQVEKVNPDLVARDAEGKINTVRYEAVNAMLLNEFLKEHRKVETQDKKVQQLETIVVQLKAALKEQTARIQKVSEQLELSRPAPQLVADNQ